VTPFTFLLSLRPPLPLPIVPPPCCFPWSLVLVFSRFPIPPRLMKSFLLYFFTACTPFLSLLGPAFFFVHSLSRLLRAPLGRSFCHSFSGLGVSFRIVRRVSSGPLCYFSVPILPPFVVQKKLHLHLVFYILFILPLLPVFRYPPMLL